MFYDHKMRIIWQMISNKLLPFYALYFVLGFCHLKGFWSQNAGDI